jgi:hypothetical protein
MSNVAVIIPFRDRGIDSRRKANLDVVQAWWFAHGFEPQIVDDGLSGDAQFNRHRAYNRAVSRNPEADVFVFAEADMLIHPNQIRGAILLADDEWGLVVPFTQYRYLSNEVTARIRNNYHDLSAEELAEWWSLDVSAPASVFGIKPESTMEDGSSIGAVNVVSRGTLEITGGFTEATEGNWYDDRIIDEGFAYLTGNPTRHVTGPAVHLYHLPGHKGAHLTEADKRATKRNRDLLVRMRADIRLEDRDRVKRLLSYREGVQR